MEPNDIHHALMASFKQVLADYRDRLSGIEMLAVTSQLVGNILALQDGSAGTVAQYVNVMQTNIAIGNAEAVSVLGGTLQ